MAQAIAYTPQSWTLDQHAYIASTIQKEAGLTYVKGREEYTLLKGVKGQENFRKSKSFP